jgi:hypothetical protein
MDLDRTCKPVGYEVKSEPIGRYSDYFSAQHNCVRRKKISRNRAFSIPGMCARSSRCNLTSISRGRDRQREQNCITESRCDRTIGTLGSPDSGAFPPIQPLNSESFGGPIPVSRLRRGQRLPIEIDQAVSLDVGVEQSADPIERASAELACLLGIVQ